MRWVLLCGSLNILWRCLSLGLKWKLTFSSLVATAEFSKFAGILNCSSLTSSSFRIWNSSTGIPSPLLALFIVMLPKAHLTLHSRMSDHTIMYIWVLKIFLYSSSVYSCHLFLISSASVRSVIVPIFAWDVPLESLIFMKRSLVFPILLLSSISLHWSLRKAFLSLLAILWSSSFWCRYLSFSPLPLASLLFTATCKASSDNHFAFLHFLFLGMVLITASCTVSWTSVHHSSGTLSIRSNLLTLFVTSTL